MYFTTVRMGQPSYRLPMKSHDQCILRLLQSQIAFGYKTPYAGPPRKKSVPIDGSSILGTVDLQTTETAICGVWGSMGNSTEKV